MEFDEDNYFSQVSKVSEERRQCQRNNMLTYEGNWLVVRGIVFGYLLSTSVLKDWPFRAKSFLMLITILFCTRQDAKSSCKKCEIEHPMPEKPKSLLRQDLELKKLNLTKKSDQDEYRRKLSLERKMVIAEEQKKIEQYQRQLEEQSMEQLRQNNSNSVGNNQNILTPEEYIAVMEPRRKDSLR